jgi:hypothetical protein
MIPSLLLVAPDKEVVVPLIEMPPEHFGKKPFEPDRYEEKFFLLGEYAVPIERLILSHAELRGMGDGWETFILFDKAESPVYVRSLRLREAA